MENSVDLDETPRSAASHLGLHCLLRLVCPNTYGNPFSKKGTLTNSVDPDRTPQKAMSDHVLHCLQLVQKFLQNMVIMNLKKTAEWQTAQILVKLFTQRIVGVGVRHVATAWRYRIMITPLVSGNLILLPVLKSAACSMC